MGSRCFGRPRHRTYPFVLDRRCRRFLPPDLPAIIGKAALRQYVESSLRVPGFRITWSIDEAVLSPDGQFAYLLGNNAVTMDDPTGEPVTTKGRAVTICNEEPTGNGASPWTSGMRSQLLAGRDDQFTTRLRSPTSQRPTRRRSDFRCAAVRSAVVWRAECSQQRS